MSTSLPLQKTRKSPQQARSRATVEVIRQASIQVLVAEGLHGCTTTRVAERAGVSVGSVYQYYPNRQAMLIAVLDWYLQTVVHAVEQACAQQHGRPLAEQCEALVRAFVHAKLQHVDVSRALYAISELHGGTALGSQARKRSQQAFAAALATAADVQFDDCQAVAEIGMAAIIGPLRSLLEDGAPAERVAPLQAQLVVLLHSYLASTGVAR
ncbi:TetR/AcrR family transcriptional regulator [Xanthomonas vesicatoria]|nr:TetR/AcrR family transcriptional regulator [Xanthomonas vesicatoria]MCC8609282.1 TetR/AcrR family transcriptional regulator [Xanthomonas vesicatoria]MCC8616971.1 TetR/AcrR family transcriptional regulator [Xanthomonas vesicatoria]MCC8683429.1 TetR/AcrR family transcriptional regulator [Xanthomonas vesicatoria]